MYSKYLDKDFNIKAEDFEDVQIIPHSILEDIFFNQITTEYAPSYEESLEYVNEKHAVVKCTVNDKKGRHIECIGESTDANLKTEIAQGIPVTMAEIRAFDRAVIRYLAFKGKVYSESEGVDTSDKVPVTDEKDPSSENTAVKQSAGIVSKPAASDSENEKPVTAPVKTQTPDKDADVKVEFGFYSGRTLGELVKTEKTETLKAWAEKLLTYNYNDEKKAKIHRYLDFFERQG